MSATNNGGPAFPAWGEAGDHIDGGMTLRDYFAAKALESGEASNWRDNDFQPRDGLSIIENTAIAAYEFADAMLKAREA